jgi:hypothetical protein
MKKILTIVLTCSILFTFAQEKTVLEGVTARGFSGVQTLNGDYFYTFHFGEKTETKGMANFILAIFDKDLKEVKKTEIEISKNSELAASSFNGTSFLFIFSDVMKRKRTMASFDKQGNMIKLNVEEDVRMTLLMEANNPSILGLTTDEFLIVRPEKDKKFGYDVERVKSDLTSTYIKSFFPEKGSWTIEDCKLEQGNLFLLRNEKASFISDKHVYSVQSLNASTGDVTYTTALVNDDDGGFPDFINVDEKGQVVTGGMYFNNGKYDDRNSDGLFFAMLGADGSITKFNKTTWKKVKDQIKGDFSSDLVGGRTKVLIEDLIRKNDGTYMVIGETWRKSNDASNTGAGALRGLAGMGGGSSSSSNSSDKGFTLMDFAMFNFDANGELTSIDKIEKTVKEAIITGSLAEENGLAMAQSLYKRKFFCYRNTIMANGKQYIMYKNDDGFKTKAYFLPVGATSTNGIGNIDMDKWVSESLNKIGKISKAMGNTKYTIGGESSFGKGNSELFKNIIPASAGKVLIYQMKQGELTMWLENVPQ